tara:strand:- start:2485 stop:4833 length:2349 start_codon:yes stop_codon:yes gene_type:complete
MARKSRTADILSGAFQDLSRLAMSQQASQRSQELNVESSLIDLEIRELNNSISNLQNNIETFENSIESTAGQVLNLSDEFKTAGYEKFSTNLTDSTLSPLVNKVNQLRQREASLKQQEAQLRQLQIPLSQMESFYQGASADPAFSGDPKLFDDQDFSVDAFNAQFDTQFDDYNEEMLMFMSGARSNIEARTAVNRLASESALLDANTKAIQNQLLTQKLKAEQDNYSIENIKNDMNQNIRALNFATKLENVPINSDIYRNLLTLSSKEEDLSSTEKGEQSKLYHALGYITNPNTFGQPVVDKQTLDVELLSLRNNNIISEEEYNELSNEYIDRGKKVFKALLSATERPTGTMEEKLLSGYKRKSAYYDLLKEISDAYEATGVMPIEILAITGYESESDFSRLAPLTSQLAESILDKEEALLMQSIQKARNGLPVQDIINETETGVPNLEEVNESMLLNFEDATVDPVSRQLSKDVLDSLNIMQGITDAEDVPDDEIIDATFEEADEGNFVGFFSDMKTSFGNFLDSINPFDFDFNLSSPDELELETFNPSQFARNDEYLKSQNPEAYNELRSLVNRKEELESITSDASRIVASAATAGENDMVQNVGRINTDALNELQGIDQRISKAYKQLIGSTKQKEKESATLDSFVRRYEPANDEYINTIAQILNVDPSIPLKDIPLQDLANAIAQGEGFYNDEDQNISMGSASQNPAQRNNNPGNLKFANQPGAIGQDEAGFAIFRNVEDGWQALYNQLRLDQLRSENYFSDSNFDDALLALNQLESN